MQGIHAANRLGLDYRHEAEKFGPPPAPIIDAHLHVNGAEAGQIFKQVMELYGVTRLYSMSQFQQIPVLREVFGDAIRFIAVPDYMSEDHSTAFTTGWLKRIEQFAELGCRICKFWAAPRSRDYEDELNLPGAFRLDGQWRREAMKVAMECGMMFMTHVADPDTWFASKYTDTERYGTKLDQYQPFEELLDETGDVPWIAAHMAGFPEDLEFIDGLLTRHHNLFLDSSATKWMVRELSKHSRADFLAFFTKWDGRILFGSDIVTTDEHLGTESAREGPAQQATTRNEAFDLYASRYWALRTMLETDYDGESSIVDPDLHMVEPDRYDEQAAPPLRGKGLPQSLLRTLYHDAAVNLLDEWHRTNT